MAEDSIRAPIDDDAEDALQRLLDSTQNLQRRIFRMSRRGFMTRASVGQIGYDAASISRDVADLESMVAK